MWYACIQKRVIPLRGCIWCVSSSAVCAIMILFILELGKVEMRVESDLLLVGTYWLGCHDHLVVGTEQTHSKWHEQSVAGAGITMFPCSKGQNGGGGWAGITMFLCSKGQNGGQELQCSCVLRGRMGVGVGGQELQCACVLRGRMGGRNYNVPVF